MWLLFEQAFLRATNGIIVALDSILLELVMLVWDSRQTQTEVILTLFFFCLLFLFRLGKSGSDLGLEIFTIVSDSDTIEALYFVMLLRSVDF